MKQVKNYKPKGYIDESTSLSKLKIMTDKLNKSKAVSNYGVLGGVSTAEELLYLPEISVAHISINKGSTFPTHSHSQKEWILPFKGKIKYISEEKEIVLECGDMYYTYPNIQHSVECLETAELVVITIPCEEGFPHG